VHFGNSVTSVCKPDWPGTHALCLVTIRLKREKYNWSLHFMDRYSCHAANWSNHDDEGLTPETSASLSLHGRTLSTCLISNFSVRQRYLTIWPVARKGYVRVNSPWGEAEWAIDPWPLRAKGLIVLVSPNYLDRKGNNKVSKCKLKK